MHEIRIEDIIQHFAIYGDLVSCKPMGNGHINNTFCSTVNQAGREVHYTHQRINKKVFTQPDRVIENILSVTAFLRTYAQTQHLTDISRRTLTLIPTHEGTYYHIDENGDYWRTYLFIEGVQTYEVLESPDLAYKLGAAVGSFHEALSGYTGPALFDTIPRFHDMGLRYAQLDEAVEKNRAGRLGTVQQELGFLYENRKRAMVLTDGLASGRLRSGITHNDTKLNNILFDEKTGEALCIIDLDTVMPGTVLFDTGDLIRTAVNTAAEDEPDTNKTDFNFELFKPLVQGYLEQAGSALTEYEKELIPESGRAITQIMAVRMLTDYLNGDIYYKTDYAEHNLVRARTQIALIRALDRRQKDIDDFMKGLTSNH